MFHLRWYVSGLLCGLSFTLGVLHTWGAIATQYTIIDLGTASVITIAKDDTTTVGTNPQNIATQLYPTARDLGMLPGGNFSRANAAQGQRIAGYSSTGNLGLQTHAFLYQNGIMRDLGTLDSDQHFSAAQAVTAEDVGGYCDTPDRTHIVPCLWIGGARAIDLPTLGGKDGYIDALNDRGDALGNSLTVAGDTHCTYWPAAGGVLDCHPGEQWDISYGVDLTNPGVYVGYAYPASGNSSGSRGFLGWAWGQALLPPLPGDTHSLTYAVNAYTDSVGQSCRYPDRFGICRAVAWIIDTPVELLPRVTNAQGWRLLTALGISDDGLIVGWGELNGVGKSFLLVPEETAVVAWYKWQASIARYYQARYDRWRKAIDWYYRDLGHQVRR